MGYVDDYCGGYANLALYDGDFIAAYESQIPADFSDAGSDMGMTFGTGRGSEDLDGDFSMGLAGGGDGNHWIRKTAEEIEGDEQEKRETNCRMLKSMKRQAHEKGTIAFAAVPRLIPSTDSKFQKDDLVFVFDVYHECFRAGRVHAVTVTEKRGREQLGNVTVNFALDHRFCELSGHDSTCVYRSIPVPVCSGRWPNGKEVWYPEAAGVPTPTSMQQLPTSKRARTRR
ncbi:unnamed protein product [Polarella glacialis]|uniref:Uncharacterized protein n=1 Tax=Polarella glacialis TaxID=89957 RepID=A0A813FTV0_POLGL|nr:unnamed protein product [Polarella glacialis]|mmetsp:Transcript_96914/g.175103  ORF Transcript_96914/g.175103 Transcript_96914/m.175103 type:complete len:228 (+) Transcript_96914:114-797(+)